MQKLVEKSKFQGIRNKVAGMSAGASVLLMNAICAYASSNPFTGAETTIKTLFTNLQTALTNVVVPIATCAFIFCLIMMFASSNQKKVETYRGWAATIFLCVVGIFAVNFFITLAQTIGQSF